MMSKKQSNVLLIFLFWFLIGIFIGAQNYIYTHSKGFNCTFLGTMIDQVPNFIFWGIYTPFILWLVKKHPFDNKSLLKKSILVHFIAMFIISIFHIFIFALLQLLISGEQKSKTFFSLFVDLFNNWFFLQFFFYGGVLVLGSALNYYRKYREKELATLQLEKMLVEANLSTLKMQLHPHFLFNTLNNISMLVRQSKNIEAVKIIAMLGSLLRHVLEHKEHKLISLKDEINLSEKYLRIESIRFQGRLTYKINMDQDVSETLIPDLILQPIIENALTHGLKDKVSGSEIIINAVKEKEKLIITIEDNGKGCENLSDFNNDNGYGLKITRERIAKIYGSNAKFEVECQKNMFTRITFTFPLEMVSKREDF